KPVLSIGDFDSVKVTERKMIEEKSLETVRLSSEKDDTDTERALIEVMQRWPGEDVYLFGGTGGRLDHFLQNMFLVLRPEFTPLTEHLFLLDQHNTVRFFLPGEHFIIKEKEKQFVSVFCLTPVQNLRLVGFKYLLFQEEVRNPRGYVSNEFLDKKAKISFSEGVLAVIQSVDK